jgi:hypothetical protein
VRKIAAALTLGSALQPAAISLPPSIFQLNNRGFNDPDFAMQHERVTFLGSMANTALAVPNPNVLRREVWTRSNCNDYFCFVRNLVEAN